MSGAPQALIEGVAPVVALLVRSIELRHQRRWRDALACLDAAVAINPALPLCQVDRAVLLAKLRRYDEAITSLEAAGAASSPELQELRQQLFDRARAALGRRLRRRPDDAAARLMRANLFRTMRRYPQALADYAAVLAHDALQVDALNGQGGVLLALDRPAEAVAAYARASASAPQRAELWYNLGNALQQQGRLDEARAAYGQAVDRRPDFAEAQLEIGHCFLSEGNYAAGWPAYEWRWRTAQMQGCRLASGSPPWLGGDRVAGKTVLVWAEQGAGDTLQFVRFVPRLLAVAGRVLLRVPAPLRRLMASLDPRLEVIGDDLPLPAHDLHCPLLSLPLALGVELADTAGAAYLRAAADDVARWRERLGASGRRRVGIAWAGRQLGLPNPSRDVPPTLLAPLAASDVELVSLQVPAADARALQAMPGLRCGAQWIDDFGDTAALIETLDLVICVDTAVAHLAGALGKPCWLMLRHSGEWRWGRGRSDSPWYPGLTIFRQSTPGDWVGVVARIAAALAAMAGRGVAAQRDRSPTR